MKTQFLTAQKTEAAARLLFSNEVVALPTETVYGLAGNAFSVIAVRKIFEAKARPHFDPLIVHVSQTILKASSGPLAELVRDGILSAEILNWHESAKINAAFFRFWPGPLTFILPRGPQIPDLVTSGQATVGIRCPAHSVFQEILSQVSFPLAAPSANQFGRISPTRAEAVLSELNGKISAVVDGGPCEVGVESTIIQILPNSESPFLSLVLLRPGKISAEELSRFFKIPIQVHPTQMRLDPTLAPGMLENHYAPQKKLILVPFSFSRANQTQEFLKSFAPLENVAYLGMSEVPNSVNPKQSRILSPTGDLEEMAKNLFSFMRELDQISEVETIVADIPCENPSPSTHGLALAIRDRLYRASVNKPSCLSQS